MHRLEALGERVHIMRRRRALSQRDLAARANVTPLTISRIERGIGTRDPHPTTLRGIADALGVDPGWLLFGDEDPVLQAPTTQTNIPAAV